VGTVLVVDADPSARGKVAATIADAGHTVLATSQRDALAALGDGGIDVVVVDSYDPRAGVVELARDLETLPDAPPVVLVSPSPHAPEISARIGVAAFVPKPLDAGELAAVISRVMSAVRPVRVVDTAEDDPSGPTIAIADRG
jgi:DNA-binding NtrC family response regulator